MAYEDLDAWSRLLLDDPLAPPAIYYRDSKPSCCPVCGSKFEEIRCLVPSPDCGGCETCDGAFGGTYMCANHACDQRTRAIDLVTAPEPEGYVEWLTTKSDEPPWDFPDGV